MRCRIATSLLYGETDEQRRQALAAEDPAELPWIKSSLDRLDSAVASLRADQAPLSSARAEPARSVRPLS